MKKLTLLTVLLAVVSSLSAQYAVVKGKCKIDNLHKVVLYSVVNGQLSEHSSTTLDDNAGFAFMFCPQKEGFYYLGDKDKKTTHRIYITTGGDEVNIEIEPDTYTLTGSNSEENKVLSAWTKLSYDVRFKSLKFWKTQSYYKDFFPELDKLAEQAKDFKVKTNNKFFNKLMKKTIDWDVEYYALNLLVTPRQKHPAKEDYTDYYNNIIKNKKFDSDLLLYNDYAMKYIDAYNMYRVISGKDVVDRTKPYDPFSNVKNISDKTLQGEFILHHCNRLKTLSEFFDVRDRYGKYLANDEQKERFHLIELPLRKYGEGEPAIDFTYQDINGKMVSLSDFKGKLVLVDVWATWCGPCKQQLPYMNKLEEEYEGKDIVFVSVSVDEKKDKWMKMVKDKNLGGVQLWAEGWDTSITRDYNIQGIPRFMLFDKEGKIINTKCPRPSQPELKELIDSKL